MGKVPSAKARRAKHGGPTILSRLERLEQERQQRARERRGRFPNVEMLAAGRGQRTFLEMSSVQAPVRDNYRDLWNKFMVFVRENQIGLSKPSDWDAALCDYYDVLFFEGQPVDLGTSVRPG